VARFGAEVLADDGTLDRKRLAARVFGDETARRDLNAITHPRVGALSVERTNEIRDRGEPLACYEVPLLFENHLDEVFRPVVLVTTSLATQVTRAMSRDGATEAEVRARVQAQMPLQEKVPRSDYVIDNDGPLEATLARADDVLDAICTAAGVPPSRYPR